MKVPTSIGSWLTKNGFSPMSERWTVIDRQRDCESRFAYMYVMKNRVGYLVTVNQVTGMYLVEVLMSYTRVDFIYQGRGKKLKIRELS